ncbi:MAG TPA: hypothetical protein DCS63_06800 [Elusimicrobia bacterium]|nr:hypothetical protein [Elusimicrobiota bacterium]
MKSINLIAFSAIVSLAAAASAAPSFESLLNTNVRSESLTAAESPAPLPEERCVYPGDDAPIEDILIWIECMAYPPGFPPEPGATRNYGAVAEKSVMMSRLNINALKTIALSLRDSSKAASEAYARGVQETAADIEQAVAGMEQAIKTRNSIMLRSEASRMEPMAARLAGISAGIQGSQAGNNIKKISENLNTYLLAIRSNSAFL